MKSIFTILVASLFFQPSGWRSNNTLTENRILNQLGVNQADRDTCQPLRFTNASSLKRLPAVIRDLTAALSDPLFQDELLLGKNKLSIYVYDVTCNSFENSAGVLYQTGDTVYRLKLNRFNQLAADRALATTLIHEIMHCVLLDIYTRAKKKDEKAMARVMDFGLNKNDTSNFFNNDFFVQMNSGNDGQHELIYELFFPRMVALLERFARIHGKAFADHRNAEYLIWSGLQKTTAYQALSDEEKSEIELTIFETKGINIEQHSRPRHSPADFGKSEEESCNIGR
jgi:hypothetical protein